MQRIVFVASRFIFVGIVMVLFLALFVGEIVTINSKHASGGIFLGKSGQNQVVVAAAAEETTGNNDRVHEIVTGDDARPLLIKKYLEKYQSPLSPYSDLIFKLSETYGFDYYWIVAIAQQESNLCKKIPEDSHNCWGYGIHKSGTLKFDSYELALKSYAEYLKREYFDKGYDTPEKIMKKYCPGSNGSWAYGVSHFIEEIETGKF